METAISCSTLPTLLYYVVLYLALPNYTIYYILYILHTMYYTILYSTRSSASLAPFLGLPAAARHVSGALAGEVHCRVDLVVAPLRTGSPCCRMLRHAYTCICCIYLHTYVNTLLHCTYTDYSICANISRDTDIWI